MNSSFLLSAPITNCASEGMLRQAQLNTLECSYRNDVTYILGDIHQPELFDPQSFDCIVSRQAVCYFYNPLVAFQNWHKWLESNGLVTIVDGLWSRESWGNSELIDKLPLSCVQTRATVSYILEESGFRIIDNSPLSKMNEYLIRTGKSTSLRYIVIACKI